MLLQCKNNHSESILWWDGLQTGGCNRARWQVRWTDYVHAEFKEWFLLVIAMVKVMGLMLFPPSKKRIFSLCFPCWLPRPGRGRGTEYVIANLSFISSGSFCATPLRVPFSQLISCTPWMFINYTKNALDLARDDERAIKVHLPSTHPVKLFMVSRVRAPLDPCYSERFFG